MSSITTPVIGLFKPVPGTAEPFRVSDLNDNMDLLDAAYGTIEDSVEAANDAAAAANAATEASDAALDQFEIDSAAAIAAIDTDAVIDTIIAEGIVLDIDGGTA
jgi:hypothetical protein